MPISQDGQRTRYYAERKKVQAQEGNPIHEDVTDRTRRRIAHELIDRRWYHDKKGIAHQFDQWMFEELMRVFDRGTSAFNKLTFALTLANLSIDDFLQALEIGVSYIVGYREHPEADIEVIQSLLADDLSIYRFVDTGPRNSPRFQIQKIDNAHLHREVAERTFELTQIAEFAAAQKDYADAWRHYSKGDLDDAVANAGKAVESACKAVVKKVDPSSTPENMNLGPLVGELVRLDVIPQQLTHTCTHLEQLFRASGTLRNQAGAAHGSLDPTSPEASTALLALRLSGSLIAFLAERWTQMRP